MDEILAETLSETITASFIEGAADEGEHIEVPEDGDEEENPVTIEKSDLQINRLDFPGSKAAATRLATRGIYTPEDFRRLSDEARSRAFTITAKITNEARQTVRDRIAEMIEVGADRQAFSKEFETLPLSPAHLEQVFRNNINSAYSEGIEDVLGTPLVGDQFPYRAYNAIIDDRVRPEHAVLEVMGIGGSNIYHKDDPVWTIFRPPWSWNCRCAWRPISIREAAKLGIEEAKLWLTTGIEPPHTFVTPPPFQPDPLWMRAHAPLSA